MNAIIVVGYRANSYEATQFRIWATNTLKDNDKIKKEIADTLALEQYKKFRVIQDQKYISDFDKLVEFSKDNN